jgi:hypothetical protein
VPIGQSQLSSATRLTLRLLWNREVGKRPRPLPVVVLLGPSGAGKTHALRSISEDCAAGVVHAMFNFERHQRVTTVEALAQIAFDLSRRWRARPAARFTRFALGMIAVQTPLDGMSREQASNALLAAIEDFSRIRGAGLADRMRGWLDSTPDEVTNIFDLPLTETLKSVLPSLLNRVTRKPLSEAKSWHADIPEAEGASPLDALISLNRQARKQPADMTAWLTAAFLADIRENHPRMAAPEPGSPCACDNPDKRRHWHNWVLLLDNLDAPGGAEFIGNLLAARNRHLREHPNDHDPLLIIATSGRWNPDWEAGWRPPWQVQPDKPDRTRTVPRCRDASYEHWAGEQPLEHTHPRHYPVLLEPLSIDETAQILGTSQFASECALVQRATGGLPAAVHALQDLLRQRQPQPGARDALQPTDATDAGRTRLTGATDAGRTRLTGAADAWRTRLTGARLADHLPDIGIDEFVSAAPFATAPWLVPAEATSQVARANLGRILTELRTALWVTAPTKGGATPNYAELHPWIARTLVSALAYRDPESGLPGYTTQFERFLDDPDTNADQTRKAYCRLALGRISDVVTFFESSFDLIPHQDWIERLRLVTRAPDNLPLDRDCGDLYERLVDNDIQNTPRDRSPAGNVIARLIVASWLAANPFTMADKDLMNTIEHAYRELSPLSRRPDVAPLQLAAQLAAGTML